MLARITKTTPIVAATIQDPVGSGLAASLRQPGGNVTGLSSMSSELWPKRMQLLHEAFPRVTHLGMLFAPGIEGSVSQAREIESTAVSLGMRVSPVEIRQPADVDPAFKRAATLGAQAWAVTYDGLTLTQSRPIADQLIRVKVPGMFAFAAYAEAGGLMSYAASFADNFRRVAAQVDKIFRGTKPGDLAIEQPTRFELVVNLKTAKAIGVTIRESVLVGVDRVIE
jgi:putative ABC transport system substrate-binding protein